MCCEVKKDSKREFCWNQVVSTLLRLQEVCVGSLVGDLRSHKPKKKKKKGNIQENGIHHLSPYLFLSICLYTIHIHIPNTLWAKSFQSCLTHCDLTDYSLPGSSVHGILQARILKWVAMPSSRGSSWPRDQTHVSNIFCTGRWVLYH